MSIQKSLPTWLESVENIPHLKRIPPKPPDSTTQTKAQCPRTLERTRVARSPESTHRTSPARPRKTLSKIEKIQAGITASPGGRDRRPSRPAL